MNAAFLQFSKNRDVPLPETVAWAQFVVAPAWENSSCPGLSVGASSHSVFRPLAEWIDSFHRLRTSPPLRTDLWQPRLTTIPFGLPPPNVLAEDVGRIDGGLGSDKSQPLKRQAEGTHLTAKSRVPTLNTAMTFTCPVCGYPGLTEEPRSPRTGGGSYEICPSCGFQFGVTDDADDFTYEAWRNKWIAEGMQWDRGSTQPPAGWNPREQLRRAGLSSTGDR